MTFYIDNKALCYLCLKLFNFSSFILSYTFYQYLPINRPTKIFMRLILYFLLLLSNIPEISVPKLVTIQ